MNKIGRIRGKPDGWSLSTIVSWSDCLLCSVGKLHLHSTLFRDLLCPLHSPIHTHVQPKGGGNHGIKEGAVRGSRWLKDTLKLNPGGSQRSNREAVRGSRLLKNTLTLTQEEPKVAP